MEMNALTTRSAAVLGILAIFGSQLLLVNTSALAQGVYTDFTECSDGIDNDGDARTDYPEDEGCHSLEDDSEGPSYRGVFVTLTDQEDEVHPNGHLTYTITLSNDRDDVKLVDVSFLMPHQTNLISASNTPHRDGVFLRWNDVVVEPGVLKKLYVNISVHARVEPELLLVAEVNVQGEKATDTTRVTLDDYVPFRIAPQIVVDNGKAYAEPSEILTYRITARNNDQDDRKFTLRTQLPANLIFMEATGPFSLDNRDLEWRNLVLRPQEKVEFLLRGYVERDAEDFTVIRLRVSAGAELATDTTTVMTGPKTSESVSLSDGHETAKPGEQLTYEVSVSNDTNVLATEVDINFALPSFAEFVSADGGGYWTGDRVRWHNMTVSPNGRRAFYVTARVRSDAPLGEQLRAVVDVRGTQAIDVTEVSTQSIGAAIKPVNQNTLVSKVASNREVRPGDTVTFTVTVRNTTDRPLSNVKVDDRMDLRYMKVLNSQGGQAQGDSIIWTIPSLNPGQTWTKQYTVQVLPTTPHGTVIKNIVTVSGKGLETLSLTERVTTTQIGVVRKLPPTGAAWDAIFLALISTFGIFGTALQSRKR